MGFLWTEESRLCTCELWYFTCSIETQKSSVYFYKYTRWPPKSKSKVFHSARGLKQKSVQNNNNDHNNKKQQNKLVIIRSKESPSLYTCIAKLNGNGCCARRMQKRVKSKSLKINDKEPNIFNINHSIL